MKRGKLVLLEGVDRVGKTTLANKLHEQAGFIYLKDEKVVDTEYKGSKLQLFNMAKCDTSVVLIKHLLNQGYNVVMDRLHLTEFSYGMTFRDGACYKELIQINDFIKEDCLLVLVRRGDLSLSDKLANQNQDALEKSFNMIFSIVDANEKLTTSYNSLEHAYKIIMDSVFEYDFYFASPWFTQEQLERETRLINKLRRVGFRVFSPREACDLNPKADDEARQEVFESNCEAIFNSKAVFAVTDGKDMGTIWEAGYAYGIHKPVVYFAETLGENKFNLMLAQSGVGVFKSDSEVKYRELVDVYCGKVKKYKGDIE